MDLVMVTLMDFINIKKINKTFIFFLIYIFTIWGCSSIDFMDDGRRAGIGWLSIRLIN